MEHLVEQQRRDAKLLGRQRSDQPLRVERTVVIAYAGLVAPHDEVGATVILAHQRVQQGLPWPGVPHRRDQGGQQHPLGREGPQRRLVSPHAHLDRHVAVLGRPDQRVQQQAVADLQRAPLQVLMRPVDRVAGLEAGDPAPASRGERRPRLRRSQRVPARHAVQRPDHSPDRAGNRQGGPTKDPGDTRMGGVAGPKHPLRLAQLVTLVHLADLQHTQRATAHVAEREPVAADPGSVRYSQTHRNRPQQPVRQPHRVRAGLVLGAAHEPCERAVDPGGQRPQISRLRRGEDQRGRALDQLRRLFRVEPTVDETAAVRDGRHLTGRGHIGDAHGLHLDGRSRMDSRTSGTVAAKPPSPP